ncbi:GAF domain-containing protein [Halostella sp. JP-L12]|uniref:bacterio-opsin activator domain-containing protein n=1 Tax=Halostella TaxID=1843185 RepID=UPI0013CE7AA9|nr:MULTISPECIES: bacterio-opsin activator domain-containing protein [Halostella]NHN47333.1 GAF domain-containing protein [Halostella sp. JP-L12]
MTTTAADDRAGHWFGEAEYDRLTAAAETYREALLVRLAGEAGLRAAEMVRVRPGDLRRARADPDRHLLAVRDGDGEVDRETVVPPGLEREIRRYASDLAGDETLVDVSPRRVQMLVADVTSRAADRTGDGRYADLAVRDLRQYFARRLLLDAEVSPRVAKAVGGWGSFAALEPYLDPPDEERVVGAIDALVGREASDAVGADDRRPAGGLAAALEAAEDCCAFRLDAEGCVESWPESAERVLGRDAADVLDRHVSVLYTDEAVEEGRPEHHLTTAAEEGRYEGAGYRVRGDGSRAWCHAVVAPVGDGGDGFAALVVDLTARKRQLDSVRDERDRLRRLGTVAEAVRSAAAGALDATDRSGIERAVCASLTDDAYAGAWIGVPGHASNALSPETAAGVDRDAAGRIADALAAAGDVERAVESGDPVVRSDAGPEPLPDAASEAFRRHGIRSLALVPLPAAESSHGVLCVLSERADAFGADERAHLDTLGRRVGHAVTALRRRQLLLSDAVVELAFRVDGDRSFFNRVTGAFDCRLALESLVSGSDGALVYYVTLSRATPPEAFEFAADDDGVADFRLVETRGDEFLLEFVLSGSAPSVALTRAGATVRRLDVDGGESTLVAELAPDTDVRSVIDELVDAFPSVELLGKRSVEGADPTVGEFRRGVDDRLTDRQESALRAAYFGGYFDWPRESTAEEIADAMGVSSPTLHNHLRKGQRELLRTVFDAADGGD